MVLRRKKRKKERHEAMAQSRTAKILEQKKTRGGKKITVNLNHDVDGLL